jgi:hypothetical protein
MRERESGQAAVEAALTLPLMTFLFLGTLQLFLCYQARLLAVYAASRAVSAGSRNHGSCTSMNDAALAALLPAVESFLGPYRRGTPTENFAAAFRERTQGQPFATYSFRDGIHNGTSMFWLVRELPLSENEELFDLPTGQDRTLTLRLVFWYPMRIPFADWVLSAMFRAHYGLQDYVATNPLISPETAAWHKTVGGLTLEGAIGSELQSRAAARQYVFPITVGWAMRMMTPSRAGSKNCPPTPGGL